MMKTIAEASQEVPLLYDADVVVVGGGPAGVGAALSAARNGARTALVEYFGCLGGTQTLTNNPTFSFVDNRIQGGIIGEIMGKLEKAGATFNSNPGCIRAHWGARESGCIYFDAEYYKHLLDTMMIEAGVKLFFHCFAVDVVRENNLIKGIIVESAQGRNAILAKTVIDCSGFGHIAWKSGASCLGEEGFPDNRWGPFQGLHMGLGYGFYLRGLDYARFRAYAEENEDEWDYWVRGKKLFARCKAEGTLHVMRGSCLMIEYANGRVWVLSPTYPLAKGQHPWLADVMSEGEIDLRQQTWSVYRVLRDNVPGFENTTIEQTPSKLMMRDAHRLDGEYVLKEDDMRSARKFDDSITCSNMPIDVFFPNGSHRFRFDVTPYDIPFRCLQSKEYDNLLAAGSVTSCDITTWTALRYCTVSVCTGQAAGTAAALANKAGISPKALDVRQLQNALHRQGMITSSVQLSPEVITEYKLRTKLWTSAELVL